MTEPVPADITAAIEVFERLVRVEGHEFSRTRAADCDAARAALETAILHHLRGYDEMKTALELQTSGGA